MTQPRYDTDRREERRKCHPHDTGITTIIIVVVAAARRLRCRRNTTARLLSLADCVGVNRGRTLTSLPVFFLWPVDCFFVLFCFSIRYLFKNMLLILLVLFITLLLPY